MASTLPITAPSTITKASLGKPVEALSEDFGALLDLVVQVVPEMVQAVPETAAPAETPPTPLDPASALLAALDLALAAGELPDPVELEGAIDTLAGALGVSLQTPLSPQVLAKAADPTSDTLVAKLATLAQKLLASGEENAPLGNKLSALVGQLQATGEDGGIDTAALANLGLSADLKALDTRLDQMIAALTPAPPKLAPAPNFGTASLDVPELKTADAAPISTPQPDQKLDSPAPAVPQKSSDNANSGKDRDTKRDTATIVAAGTAQADQPTDTAATPTARIVPQTTEITAAQRLHAPYQTAQQQLNLPQIAFEMVRQVQAGTSRFQIRLDPADLGRIDVRMDIDTSGNVNARLTVERAETLDLLQRDQRALERALAQAGLDGSKTNLEFSLRQNPSGGGNQQGGTGRQPMFDGQISAQNDDVAPAPTITLYRGALSASGINIVA